jgi:hypothetical protein
MNPMSLEEAKTYYTLLRQLVFQTPPPKGVVLQYAFNWADVQVAAMKAEAKSIDLMPNDAHTHADAMCRWLNHLTGHNAYFVMQFDAGEYSLESDFTHAFPMLDAKARRAPAMNTALQVATQLKAFFLLSFGEAARQLPGAQQHALETTRRKEIGPTVEDRGFAAEKALEILHLAGLGTGRFLYERAMVGNQMKHALVLDVRGLEPRMTYSQLQTLAGHLSAAINHGQRTDPTFAVCFTETAGSLEIDRMKNNAPVVGVAELRGVWTTGSIDVLQAVGNQLAAFGLTVQSLKAVEKKGG